MYHRPAALAHSGPGTKAHGRMIALHRDPFAGGQPLERYPRIILPLERVPTSSSPLLSRGHSPSRGDIPCADDARISARTDEDRAMLEGAFGKALPFSCIKQNGPLHSPKGHQNLSSLAKGDQADATRRRRRHLMPPRRCQGRWRCPLWTKTMRTEDCA